MFRQPRLDRSSGFALPLGGFQLGAPLLIAAAFATSCGRSGEFADASRPPVLRPEQGAAISTGLNAIDRDDTQPPALRADAEPTAEDRTAGLLTLMEQAQRNSNISVDPPTLTAPPTPSSASALAGTTPAPLANPGVSYSLPAEPRLSLDTPEPGPFAGVETPSLPEVPTESRENRRARLIAELGALLDEEATASPTPAPMLAQIVALKFLALPPSRTLLTSDNPGGELGGATKPPPETPAGLNDPRDPLDDYLNSGSLSPREKDMLGAWKDFVSRARSALLQHHDLAAVAEPAGELADSLGAWTPLTIAQVRLCSKVDGYGVYHELRKFGDQYKFLVGRPARMIVYVEPASFTRTRVSREGVWGHEVALTQDLRLFHAAHDSDTLVWRRPDQEITDFSRNRRRDFFIVQVVELPSTLSVGSYRLKIILTEKTSGAQAEAIIPIELVADASALLE